MPSLKRSNGIQADIETPNNALDRSLENASTKNYTKSQASYRYCYHCGLPVYTTRNCPKCRVSFTSSHDSTRLSEPVLSYEALYVCDITQPIAIQETPDRSSADKWLSPEVAVNTKQTWRLPDLGASTDDIITDSAELFDQSNRMTSPANMSVKSVDSQSVEVMGTRDLPINVNNETLSIPVNAILSLDEVLIMARPSTNRLDTGEQIVISTPSKFEEQFRDLCPIPVTLEHQPVTWDPGGLRRKIQW